MPENLLKKSKGYLKGNLLNKASVFLDEKIDDIKESIDYVVPLLYSGITHSINKGKANIIFEAIKEYDVKSLKNKDIESLFSGENSLLLDKNNEFLSLIFNNSVDDGIELIADSAEIHTVSATALLTMFLPATLNAIADTVKTGNLDVDGFSELIENQKTFVYKKVSADFMNKMIHDVGFYSLDRNISNTESYKKPDNNSGNSQLVKLSGIALIALISILSFLYLNKSNKEDLKDKAENTTGDLLDKKSIDLTKIADKTVDNINLFYSPNDSILGKYIKNHENLGFFQKRALKNGQEILVLSDEGINKFLNYIEEDKPISKKAWFDLNRVLVKKKDSFDLSKSKSEINNLITILNAYPNIGVKIGGMTDNVGPADVNFNKSYKLAERFINLLIEKGIDKTRLRYEGYGENYPIKSNDSEQKHLNNRLSIRLTKK